MFETIKDNTRHKRRQDRYTNLKQLLKVLGTPTANDYSSVSLYRYELIRLLHEMNIPVLMAPYEADKFTSDICKAMKYDAVLAEDSDYIIYGVPYIPLSTFHIGTNIISSSLYTIKSVRSCLHLDERLLPVFSCLCGNDYMSEESLLNFYNHVGLSQKTLVHNLSQKFKAVSNFLHVNHNDGVDHTRILKIITKNGQKKFKPFAKQFRDALKSYTTQEDSSSSLLTSIEELTVSEDNNMQDLKKYEKNLYNMYKHILSEKLRSLFHVVDETSENPNNHNATNLRPVIIYDSFLRKCASGIIHPNYLGIICDRTNWIPVMPIQLQNFKLVYPEIVRPLLDSLYEVLFEGSTANVTVSEQLPTGKLNEVTLFDL
eukprot:TRINITY_DN2840_c0_g1_i5.p1 TRINITY_DN2840_c0_g1~~TRINITY_DN2840_c0_g1_i5.p1  ORF type:complete len:410 (-),score=31.43 TRINITY_DN2840_c0_g1_i5:25-1140(-)